MVKPRRNTKKKQPTPQPSSSENQQSEESSSHQSEESKQIEANIKTLQFRKKRGEKMSYLMKKKKNQKDDDDDDQFWKNNAYFGDIEQLSDGDDQDDYVESSEGKDQFDSDFLSSESQKQDQQEEVVPAQEQDNQAKRRRQAIQPPKHPVKKIKPNPVSQNASNSQINMASTPIKPTTLKYIHQQFTQQQLLAQAAHTEYDNYLSLQKLISLQQGKKTYNRKAVCLDPPKVVYRNKINGDKLQTTYTLVGFDQGIGFLDIKDPI